MYLEKKKQVEYWTYITISPTDDWTYGISLYSVKDRLLELAESFSDATEIDAYRNYLIIKERVEKLIDIYVKRFWKYENTKYCQPYVITLPADYEWRMLGYCFKMHEKGHTILVVEYRYANLMTEWLKLAGTYSYSTDTVCIEEDY